MIETETTEREDMILGLAREKTATDAEDTVIQGRLKKDDIYTKPNLNILSTPTTFILSSRINIHQNSHIKIYINHRSNSIIKIVS